MGVHQSYHRAVSGVNIRNYELASTSGGEQTKRLSGNKTREERRDKPWMYTSAGYFLDNKTSVKSSGIK